MEKYKALKLDEKLVEYLGDQYGIGAEPDMFGVEIEVEGVKVAQHPYEVTPGWKMVPDGSLRAIGPGGECIEYVFKGPANMAETKARLEALFKFFKSPKVKVKPSYRTSIHVHVNCLQETQRTIANFITLAIIFDELFVSLNGETRIGNNFCLRSRDAEGQIDDLILSVRKGSLWHVNSGHRYASVNYASLTKYGTVEFRSLECTTDLPRVMHWLECLQRLKVMAREYSNPKEIIQQFSRKGPIGFLSYVLGYLGTKYIPVPNATAMMQNGMRLAQDFAYCSDWESLKLGERATNPRRPRGKYGEMPMGGLMNAFVNQAAAPPPPPQNPYAPNSPQWTEWQQAMGFNPYVVGSVGWSAWQKVKGLNPYVPDSYDYTIWELQHPQQAPEPAVQPGWQVIQDEIEVDVEADMFPDLDNLDDEADED